MNFTNNFPANIVVEYDCVVTTDWWLNALTFLGPTLGPVFVLGLIVFLYRKNCTHIIWKPISNVPLNKYILIRWKDIDGGNSDTILIGYVKRNEKTGEFTKTFFLPNEKNRSILEPCELIQDENINLQWSEWTVPNGLRMNLSS